jgi:hypothetical protein
MSLRTLRRSVKNGQHPVGVLGGHCPRCDAQPLALVVDWLEYGHIVGCQGCGWTSDHPKLWLLAFVDDTEDSQGGAVVRALNPEQAPRRADRLGLIPPGCGALVVGEAQDGINLWPHEIDERLSDEQLQEIVTRQQPPETMDASLMRVLRAVAVLEVALAVIALSLCFSAVTAHRLEDAGVNGLLAVVCLLLGWFFARFEA